MASTRDNLGQLEKPATMQVVLHGHPRSPSASRYQLLSLSKSSLGTEIGVSSLGSTSSEVISGTVTSGYGNKIAKCLVAFCHNRVVGSIVPYCGRAGSEICHASRDPSRRRS